MKSNRLVNKLSFRNRIARKSMKQMDEMLSRQKSPEVIEAEKLRDQYWKKFWAERGLEYPA